MIAPEELEREILHRLEEELQKEELLSRAPKLRWLVELYLRRPAKLLRPLLLLEAARAYEPPQDPAPPEALYRLATATELLHVFALMHDDRIDVSGRPGVAPSDAEDRGALLVLAGDLLHTIAREMIHETVNSFGLAAEIPGWIKTISVKTIAGQAMELSRFTDPDSLPDLGALYELYDLKTGYYSFAAPLIVGALAARGGGPGSSGTPELSGDLETLLRVGLLLGRAFQLQDDAVDTLRLIQEGGPSVPPWELGLLVTYLSSAGRESEARLVTRSQEGRQRIIGELARLPLESWTGERIAQLRTQAEALSRALSIPEERRRRLLERGSSIARLS